VPKPPRQQQFLPSGLAQGFTDWGHRMDQDSDGCGQWRGWCSSDRLAACSSTTGREHAALIVRDGFMGRSGHLLSDFYFEDVVWLSDDGRGKKEVAGSDLILVDAPEGAALGHCEVVEEGSPTREGAVPASLVNQWPRWRATASGWSGSSRTWLGSPGMNPQGARHGPISRVGARDLAGQWRVRTVAGSA